MSTTVPRGSRVRIEPMLEIFNVFDTTNILGTSNVNYSGFSNVLVRDSGQSGRTRATCVERVRPARHDRRRRLRLGRPAGDAAGGEGDVLTET